MHPVLFHFGPVTLHTYGVFVASAFFLAIALSLRQARREGLDPNQMLDLAFYVTLAAIIGARLLFIVVEYRYFLEKPIRIFKIWEGGLVFYGGLILSVTVGIYYMKKHKMPVLKVGDIVVPSLALAQAVGRLGCLSAGCCYGKETSAPWGMVFSDPDSLVPLEKLGLRLHPTQLYSSMGDLILFLILYAIARRKRFDGQALVMYGILYPVVRFSVEIFRGDLRGAVLGGMMSTSQFISLIVFAVAVIFYIKLRNRSISSQGQE
ncbi:MAG: prolipoprotein diacylglyceryl transferase [Nitrospirae bacterium CG08_land_8_20_14_0_20_52_24]|nr:MAG: prolipoprotein diacylglyceryl transferase [Nitrospirae bacterium CG08_land_8_20_14_0_20_52_24]PIV84559.1 MAG: prolipoprotein diacylglyceryl transferase [Nitrospirae bacterium CG17_big_fil_post_rev_8_21_14_2_50_50_9]PIW86294.1 MAG: prolipoprotein diacylglyceryl transferase [Nitrospirae bacterium CG_4_8_14_3_um_filter_50_41]PIX85353.1 MAG: prolipoprotein diacylglyceryl transferase [Nitrospirae bacterium CG_4_10_14_3_um_filter_53_41]